MLSRVIRTSLRAQQLSLTASLKRPVQQLWTSSHPRVLCLDAALPLHGSIQIKAVACPHVRRSFATGAVSGKAGDIIPFNLADIGEGIAEVEIMKWFVQAGDPIKQFQKVCEVQSDKATVEITSRFDGMVADIQYQVGQMAKVGHPLMHIKLSHGTGAGAGAGPATTPAAAPTVASPAAPAAAAPTRASSPNSTWFDKLPTDEYVTGSSSTASAQQRDELEEHNDKVLTTPAVRRLAREHQIDLARVKPSGAGGRVMKEDVLAYIAHAPSSGAAARSTSVSAAPAQAAVTSAPSTSSSPAPAAPVAAAPAVVSYSTEDRVEKIAGINRIMVQSMNRAAAVPTFLYCDEVVMDALVQLRAQLKPAAEQAGIKLSFMPFIIKAASLAMRKYPRVNSHVNADCTEITIRGSHNIGVAMDTPRGLLVPNVKNVQDKSVLEIARELSRLQSLGAANKLGTADLTGGTFSLSNIGSIGGTYAAPILVVPEVAIGALGKFQVLPRYDSKQQVVPTTIMVVSWSGDHRILDGATIANFSNAWKRFLEMPSTMLAELR